MFRAARCTRIESPTSDKAGDAGVAAVAGWLGMEAYRQQSAGSKARMLDWRGLPR